MRITTITGGLSPAGSVDATPEHLKALEKVLAEQELSEHLEVSILVSGGLVINDEVPAQVYTQNYRFVESIARVVSDPIVSELNLFGGFFVETSSSAGNSTSHRVSVENGVVRFHRSNDDTGTVVELTVASDPELIKGSK